MKILHMEKLSVMNGALDIFRTQLSSIEKVALK